jgi:hypothetical protein
LAARLGDALPGKSRLDPMKIPNHPQEEPMTPILLVLTFLLLLDVLVLVGHSHDSRDGRDWQPRGSSWPAWSAAGLG